MLNETGDLQNLVDDVTVGAMGEHNAMGSSSAACCSSPGDREDIILPPPRAWTKTRRRRCPASS